jgi:dTMP kinase
VPPLFPGGHRIRVRESRVVTHGLFLTFEGIEGCGKTTQMDRAADWLKARGRAVVTTREPGGTALGVRLREALLHAREDVEPGAELLLLVADRRQHLVELIEPALAAGTAVLCDRYTDSSRAYQGAGRGLGEALVDELHRGFCPRVPDRTYLFDCPVEVALQRVAKRSGADFDKIEREDLAFHRRVRSAYRRRARSEPRRFLVLDASAAPEAVFARLEKDLEALFEPGRPRAGRNG